LTWVDEFIYAAGGEHIPANWGDFADQTGIRAVLHLRPEAPQAFLGPPPRQFLWLSVSEEREADLGCLFLAGTFLAGCVEQGAKVLLHSSLGRHRTRWAFVAYLMVRGQRWERARKLAEARPWLSPYHTEAARWEDFERWLQARRRAGDPQRPKVRG
jgi:hypothetical protein